MDSNDATILNEIASSEEHYLIHEVILSLAKKSVFVDAGAFTGEFPITLKKMNLDIRKCYSFEANRDTYEKLTKNMLEEKLEHEVCCVNKGLADTCGTMYFENESASSRIVNYKTDNKIEVTTIDQYFKDIHIDFIKMDIEGMEMSALKGGINVITRDRPILAISIYHSFTDYIEIPLYLNENLSNYNFLIRHHSIWFAETVVYCIPKEKYRTT